MDATTPRDVLDFWFDAGAKKWFAKSDEFDAEIVEKFQQVHEIARGCGRDSWAETTDGMLALIILLDQFPRNMYRDSPDMFAADAKALTLAKEAVVRGIDGEVPEAARQFIYMPFMHSERIDDQKKCVELFAAAGLKDNIAFAEDHRDIVVRFGRFPHRNQVLERSSSAEETAFLKDGGFAG
jgi:uncharacterized protein (DUF924 family)